MGSDPGIFEPCIGKTIDELIAEGRTGFFYPTKTPSNSGSIIPKRPDAIKCAKEGSIFYLYSYQNNELIYRTRYGNIENPIILNSDGKGDKTKDHIENPIIFNADGTYKGRLFNIKDEANSECEKGIGYLYENSMAFNLVSSKPDSITGPNLIKDFKYWPFALNCANDKND